MKRLVLLCFCSLALLSAMAFPVHGNDTVASSFFRDRYHQGDLLHWLDNLSDFAVVLSETTGRWNMPDQLLFSVQGNTFGQNRFYIDGFRVNDCFASGSSLFRPDMTRHSISIDTWQSRLFFISDSLQPDFVSLTGDVGGLGGINPTTRYLINVLHKSAQERFYLNTSLSHPDDGRSTGLNPENYRPHIIGAGQIEAQYSVPSESRTYRQHLYADFGWRAVPEFDRTGISGSYTANWYKLQADGEIPLRHNPADPSLHYLLNFSRRSDLGQEFWFNADEIMQNSDYSASLYLKNPSLRRTVAYTVGLTWHSALVRHNNPSFTRNLVDQDGEGFEPWVPDGASHSLTAAATLSRTFLPWLSLHYDGSNSLLFFRPDRDTWSNRLEWRSMFGTENYDLGYVTWHSNPFTAGLLENTLSLRASWSPVAWFSLDAKADATLDGVLLGAHKSFVRPNMQAAVSLAFRPCKWFEATLSAGDFRMPFNITHVRFFSGDRLNGTFYFSDGTVSGTTGGACHSLGNAPWQPRFFLVELPFRFILGRHEIAVHSSYRKFHSQWTVAFSGAPEDYGFFAEPDLPYTGGVRQVFFFNSPVRSYVTAPLPPMGGNFFSNTPFFASNLVRYTYNGIKWYVSVSWQSFIMTSLSALGNGPLANDVNVLSESLANPNTAMVTENGRSMQYVGRANQDRAYIARIMVAYNITRSWRLGLVAKFKDGQPFSNFSYQFFTDDAGHTQVALWNRRSRGINPTDGNFGSRKDAFYNLDLHLEYRAFFCNNSVLSVFLQCCNLYDFGNELTEFTFEENGRSHRYAMSLSIPRTLLLSLKYSF